MELASLARSIRLLRISVVGLAAAAHAQACGVDDGLSSFVDDDAGRPPNRGDASASGGDGGPSLGTLRLAHLAPELGTIDFCYGARTNALEGPVLRGASAEPDAAVDADPSGDAAGAGDADASDDAALDALTAVDAANAGAPGLAHARVTKYFTVQASGTITVAIVRAGAATCANPIAEGTVTLDPGKLSTVALFGSARIDRPAAGDAGDAGGEPGAPSIVAFIDDRETKPDRARVRLIHAANADALAVRAATTEIADRLEPRKTSAESQNVPVDELGFATIVPVPPPASIIIAPLAVDGGPMPARWQSGAVDLDLRGDSLHTGFVLDGRDGGFEVLWCADRTTTAELTACRRIR